jgi:hypothetical protein
MIDRVVHHADVLTLKGASDPIGSIGAALGAAVSLSSQLEPWENTATYSLRTISGLMGEADRP